MAQRTHASLDWHGGTLVLRDLAETDLERIADYWVNATPADFDRLGVDASRLGDRDWMIDRFRPMIPSGDLDQPRQIFGIELDGRLVGYTNLNCYTPDRNFSHWHLIDPAARAGGVSSALYPWRLRTYFACSRMEILTHQTRPGNEGVNRLLDRFVPIAETVHVENPDGLSRPGIFNLRYVTRAHAARIFEEHMGSQFLPRRAGGGGAEGDGGGLATGKTA